MNKEFDRSVRYPTQAYGNVPAFHNTEEEAEFWDTHDLSEFWDEGEPVKLHYNKNKSMQIRWTEQEDRELQRIADIKHIPKSTLARAWLLERLEQESNQRAS
jgi:hypothetical protein